MVEQNGQHKIQSFKRQWISYQLLAAIVIAASTALPVGYLLHHVFSQPLWFIAPLFIVFAAALLLTQKPWKITDTDVSRYLNTVYPQLEESCELVIKPAGSLNLLEGLQRSKVNLILSGLALPAQFTRRLRLSVIWLFAAILLCFFTSKINYHSLASLSHGFGPSRQTVKNTVPEKLLPQIQSVKVIIAPPAYTGKATRGQDKFNLDAEEDATVTWHIATNTAINNVELLFNEKDVVKLHPANAEKTLWTAQKQLSTPGFYQVNIGGKLSDYYKIEITKDMPPVIRIKTPKQYTYIDAGESTKVPLSVTLSDDYGISDAFIYATIAKGSGEAVKFKEQKISFSTSFTSQQKSYELQKVIDLHSLNMEPGDEFYFYVQAQDNHLQQTRTDIYIVSIQDTAQLLSMNGMTMGVSLVPEYFRSERQIIMDTEKLLKDRDSISAEQFKNRSNDLGIDQKLLRLRYGKFLGEEEESSEGGGHQDKGLSSPENFSNAQKILDAYTDKHDNAEDASFLEKDTKAQLKNTLNEMWTVELNLRTFKPQVALPFEYKALRLLKDLQQKSRAYVAKTAFNPPPLKLVEKRLSGDLSKISQPLLHQDIKANTDVFDDMKKAASVLDNMKQTRTVNPAYVHILQMAGQQLSSRATAQPNVYLPAVKAMYNILNAAATKVNQSDILKVEAALQKALPPASKLPQANQSNADMGLGQSYFKNLKHLNK
ncbi:hypothetical protein BDD43_5309 [Mucilaginibacter gracilis]|uniref:DUF4175 family protein n=1 Tax=Mucilaginibacter gracilis TaxID=423350 RepID=A0A495J8G0_9SPHI|nr:DUF4175 family protein [Mucilaginibacter gracilis]RKR85053.1 hypothetical protein BDD43_5309 [Mucilaginibacter gracilis]